MNLKRFFIFLLIIFLLLLFSVYYPKITGKTISAEYEKEPAVVLRIIDGDTIETDLGTVRLLGVNSPEKNMPYADEPKLFLKQLENKSIELLRDKEDTDKYSRKLRYIFYNNRVLNFEILEKGFANSYMASGLRYEKEIMRAEKYARENELGIWHKSDDECTGCIILLELNPKEEFFILKNICGFYCILDGWFVKDSGRNTFKISPLDSGKEEKYPSKNYVWNDGGDNFFMFDKKGKLVLFYSYGG